MNLSWSSLLGGGLAGAGGPRGRPVSSPGFFGSAGCSVGLVGNRLGPLSSSCSCWFSRTLDGKDGKFLKGLNGPNVVTSTFPCSSREVDLSGSAFNPAAPSASFLLASLNFFLSNCSFSNLTLSSSLCLSISLCLSRFTFLSNSFCSSSFLSTSLCLSISRSLCSSNSLSCFCFSSVLSISLCLSISRSLCSSNSISCFCFSRSCCLSICFCFSISFCFWISLCLSPSWLLGCSRGGGGRMGTGGSRLGSMGLKFWK